MKSRVFLATVLLLFPANGVFAAQAALTQIPALGASASIKDLRDATNTRLSATQSNFTEIYTALNGSPWLAQTTAPNIHNVFWIDTSGTSPAIKYWDGDSWEVAASGGDGTYTLPVATTSVLGGVKDGAGVTIAEDGTISADAPDLSGYALTSSVLSKTNTTAFTPTADYHPATKKYVDDSITASGGYTDEQAQDAAGAMFSGNTETGITVTYDDATGKVNFIVPTTLAGFTDDSTHRVVTDTEKSTWNAKQNALVAGTDYLTPTGSAANLTNFPSSLATDAEVTTAVSGKANSTAFASAVAFEAAFGWAPGSGSISLSTEQDWTAMQNFDGGLTASGITITLGALSDIKFGPGNWLDDTKGNGDTNYLWSADKIFDQLALKSDATHNHTGTYEPADSTLIKVAEIDSLIEFEALLGWSPGGGGTGGYVAIAPTYSDDTCTAGQYAFSTSPAIYHCRATDTWDYQVVSGASLVWAGWDNPAPLTYSLTINPVDFSGADKFTYSASDYTTDQVFSELSADASFTVTPDTGRAITCIGTGLTSNTGGSYTANTDTTNVTATCTSSVTATGYTDGFERDNESPIAAPWTISSGFDSAFRIVSYGAMGTDAGVEAVAVYTSGTFANNQYSEVKVPATFTDLMGAVVRSGTSFKQGYVFRRMSADTVQLGGWNNNEWIGSIGSCSSADFTGGATMRIEVTGSSIVGKVDGTTVCTATDTVLTTGKPGIYTKDSTVAIDDWAGGDL